MLKNVNVVVAMFYFIGYYSYFGSSEMSVISTDKCNALSHFQNNIPPTLNSTLNLTDSVNKNSGIKVIL